MNFSSKLFEPFLLVTSQIYKAIVLLRLQCYKNGWLKTHQPETPVISVGNLTVGGTGKTPVVDLLVKEIQNQKKRPAILSRGYRRKNGSTQQRFRFCE
ncbi:MAG: tetraacyldisaccharide 4'-kinase, partial [SAR324 cluster bacterium]|nr:tetraacyldisaccharide 4'-kinase [SAR324 cluster bacterium]